jgi:hypothetical protein
VGRPLVVVSPPVVRAHRERTCLDEDFGAASDRGGSAALVLEPRELQRLQHRLDVLLLVLDDEPEDEAVPEQPVVRVELRAVEHRQHPLAHLRQVRARPHRVEQLERRPLVARMLEGVVDVVGSGKDRRRGCQAAQQPELLEVADVGEIPHERRHER